VIYTKVSKHYVEKATKQTAGIGLSVLPIYIRSADDFRESFEFLSKKIDVFWLVRDPNMITTSNLVWLVKTSVKKRIPVIGYSAQLARAGLLMSVASDPQTVAAQMAKIAGQILAGTSPGKIAVAAPDKAKVTINKTSLQQLGIRIDPMLLDFVDIVQLPKPAKAK
jgi:ABC-type uncharacterized transport system substrate-binding protein